VLPELSNQLTEWERGILDRVDDYRDTIFAILGFCSLWFFDASTRERRSYIGVFQGRHLSPVCKKSSSLNTQPQKDVCPDLGVVIRAQTGIVGEVKKNFPSDDRRARKIFDQLNSYDQELTGWPTDNGELQSHELALLVHQTTSWAARRFYSRGVGDGSIKFERPFSIFVFNRSDQRVPYFFFQAVEGEICAIEADLDPYQGVPVPMQALMDLHSRSKLYDGEPPLPYLLDLIWEHVVIPLASENTRFARLRSNQKLEVDVFVDDIVEKLHEGFSFSHWHTQYPDRQPLIPRKEWVLKACRFLVQSKEARWVTEDAELRVFYRKYQDVLGHFVRLQAESEAEKDLQPMFPMFEEGTSGSSN